MRRLFSFRTVIILNQVMFNIALAGKKILIIEDEVKIARFIELELKYEGYAVGQAIDGPVG